MMPYSNGMNKTDTPTVTVEHDEDGYTVVVVRMDGATTKLSVPGTHPIEEALEELGRMRSYSYLTDEQMDEMETALKVELR